MTELLFYNASYTQYLVDSSVVIDDFCNGWTVINIGASVMFVNGIPLNPGVAGTNNGESFSVGGNRGEIFMGRIDLRFVGGAGVCVVIQKFYEPSYFRNKEKI